MKGLAEAKQLLQALSGDTLAAAQLADSVSGGHINDFLTTSQEKLDKEFQGQVAEAAIEALDLARLANTRIRVLVEVMQLLMKAEDALEKRWAARPEQEYPERRDLVAASAIVARAFPRQVNHGQRRLLIQALRGAFDPELYLWGEQDILLSAMIDARITVGDVEELRRMSQQPVEENLDALNPVLQSIDSWERLSAGDFAEILAPRADSQQHGIIRHRSETFPQAKIRARITRRGQMMLKMLDAGLKLEPT
jgi:hypothetical protein